jgi:Tfp pilus assembly protein PilF
MKQIGYTLGLIVATALLPGCASGPVTDLKGIFQNKGDADLTAGIKGYEDAKYPEATRSLQNALQAGLSDANKVKAHKYLAFIHCASGREKQCRDEFATALAIDPGFELEPAEAGHPTWGPVFRSLKSRR